MENIVLIVDDDATSLKLATSILENDYRVAAAISGEMALKYLEKNTPDLILLDLSMPGLDGFEVMQRIAEDKDHSKIPVIFVSATQTPAVEAKCLEAGAVDYVGKPYVPLVLKSRVRRTLELYKYRNQLESMVANQAKAILDQNNQIGDIQDAVIVGMANLIEERDTSTGFHVKNTQTYVRLLCEQIIEEGLYSEIVDEEYKEKLVKAAPLHDVGKVKITDLILQKPGRLSEDEYKVIQNHTRYGADIIEEILGGIEDADYLELARDVALYHHERWDGNGYPEGLTGDEIPLCARIMAIADVFDALCEDRVYHRGIRSVDTVLSIIEESGGTQFDPTLTEVFLRLRDRLKAYVENEDSMI